MNRDKGIHQNSDFRNIDRTNENTHEKNIVKDWQARWDLYPPPFSKNELKTNLRNFLKNIGLSLPSLKAGYRLK